jgi:putative addiction module component (TIGR02574 family)
MSHAELVKEAQRLSVSERLDLIDELIESVEVESGPLREHKSLLEHRYQAYLKNPDQGEPWELVRERIRGSLNDRRNDRRPS